MSMPSFSKNSVTIWLKEKFDRQLAQLEQAAANIEEEIRRYQETTGTENRFTLPGQHKVVILRFGSGSLEVGGEGVIGEASYVPSGRFS